MGFKYCAVGNGTWASPEHALQVGVRSWSKPQGDAYRARAEIGKQASISLGQKIVAAE
jgi:hypothetical protein